MSNEGQNLYKAQVRGRNAPRWYHVKADNATHAIKKVADKMMELGMYEAELISVDLEHKLERIE